MNPSELPALAAMISGVILTISFFLAFLRLVRGPALPDRIVALDLITTLTVAAIVVYVIASNQKALLDATLVVSLVAFLATVALARYLEGKTRDD